jgi:hypothetical protein
MIDPIEIYQRCLSGRPYTKDLRIYTEKYLRKVVKELEIIEEYEMCIELNKFIDQRFNHDSNYYVNL